MCSCMDVLAFCHSTSRRKLMAATPSVGDLGAPAPDFELVATDARRYRRDALRGRNGVLVMFICNHCPYVKAVVDKIVRDTRDLAAEDVGSIAIMSNDPAAYPDDSFENMKLFATRHGFTFPYVLDETQEVGRTY